MRKTSSIIIAATALVGAESSIVSAKEFIEVRRAITAKGESQGRGADDALTTTPDARQGRGTDDALTTTPDIRQGRGADDALTTTPDARQGRGTDDATTTTPDIRQGRGADDALTTTPDARQGRGADDALTTTPDARQGRGADDALTTTPDARQGRGTDDALTTTPDIRQGRGTDDAITTPDVRQGRGADDALTTNGAEDRGIVSTVVNFVTSALGLEDTTPQPNSDDRLKQGAEGITHIRQGRGTDDALTTTPDIRQGRGADDALTTTPDIRQGRGADDALTTTPDIRQGRGADDAVTTASASPANAQNTARLRAREHRVAFGASKQASQTAGLAPQAIYRTNGTQHILDVIVSGYGWQEGMGSADLENGEIIGNLPNKQRLRFAVYANTQQAQAAAWIWAKPGPQEAREDSALIAADTGIISWDAENVRPDDNSPHGIGSINGLFLTSERMPELNGSYLRGKVIQIYGPLVTSFDDAGNPASCTRQVYWTSAPLR